MPAEVGQLVVSVRMAVTELGIWHVSARAKMDSAAAAKLNIAAAMQSYAT